MPYRSRKSRSFNTIRGSNRILAAPGDSFYPAVIPRSAGASNVTHATTGVLVGQDSTVAGSATRFRDHATTGVLVGQDSTVAGSATRFRDHATTGVLTGQSATVTGSSAHVALHTTSGVLAAQGSILAGSSTRFRQISTSGVLAAQGSILAGSSTRFRQISTSGVLAAQGSILAGVAERFAGAVTHSTSGALTGQGSEIAGSSFVYLPSISGITRDHTGTQIGGCTVKAFTTADDLLSGTVVSGLTGAFIMYPTNTGPYYLVSYKAGSPDIAGTTVNTIMAE